jgi:hypothetical protein
MRRLGLVAVAIAALGIASCRFDPAYRDFPDPIAYPCTEGVTECRGASLIHCVDHEVVTIDDCGSRGMACAPSLLTCTPCLPDSTTCDGQDLVRCDPRGQTKSKLETCDAGKGFACRRDACVSLCLEAAVGKSNIGCEYWGVDLDNAVTTSGNAAAQQYAIIVSNPQPDVAAIVTIEEETAAPGEASKTRVVGTASVGSGHLEVFKLGPKEVDGSAPGLFNTGSGTALTRNAFRVRSTVPIVAYQFNPLDNVSVFSNDASLLLPVTALGARKGEPRSYVVAGWPQTIATTEDPNTNFGNDLRAFLTIVGTTPDTKVHLKSSERVIPGGPFPAGIAKNQEVDVTLQPFDVLNLETGGFNADFTGSLIDSTAPVAVFVGSEASDAPFFTSIDKRDCCADHLEDQLTPVRAVGRSYVIGRVPNRTKALAAAGAIIGAFNEGEMYRVVAATPGNTQIKTSLPAPWDAFSLDGEGANVTIPAFQDFTLESSKPVIVADIQVSQEAAGVKSGLPGGDPSLTFLPATEQWRTDNVFLTPDKYLFDFVVVAAPAGAKVFLDGLPIDGTLCDVATVGKDPVSNIYRCQLSFPVVDPSVPAPSNIKPGRQNDGVHRVQADAPVGVIVYGFDNFVSYAYAAGTELVDITAN